MPQQDEEIGCQYPAIKRQWEATWEQVIPFFAFEPEVHKVIYTTNVIESINCQLRKISKTRGHFPNDDTLIKAALPRLQGDGTRPARSKNQHGSGRGAYRWKVALNQFDVMCFGRLDKA